MYSSMSREVRIAKAKQVKIFAKMQGIKLRSKRTLRNSVNGYLLLRTTVAGPRIKHREGFFS